ncbi:MAG: mandelate racemase, partial [Candidatus Eremiobacteraeota bacterium]|nr:mandelate racemase [Candidatus Eremiobacteraeota bacterium]
GITGFARIVDVMLTHGWQRDAFWPHGGHLFTLHVAAAFGCGGSEVNPFSFAPFGGLGDGDGLAGGTALVPDDPGIGFERRPALTQLFSDLVR